VGYNYGVVGYNRGGCGRLEPVYGWFPVYGTVYNPQAKANRNAAQSAANTATQYRDAAIQQLQQLRANLPPQITANQQQMATQQLQLQSLVQQQQMVSSNP
jgi:hypothetical protein